MAESLLTPRVRELLLEALDERLSLQVLLHALIACENFGLTG